MVKASIEQKPETSKFYLTEPEVIATNEKTIENSIINPEKKKEELLVIPFSNGRQVLELLNQIEEKNLYYIQNTHESEEDLEKRKKMLKDLKEAHENVLRENNERIRVLKNAKNVLRILV